METISPYTVVADLHPKTVLFVDDLCTITRKTPESLRTWRKRCQGPRWFRLGGRVAYYAGDVASWIDSEHDASPDPASFDDV